MEAQAQFGYNWKMIGKGLEGGAPGYGPESVVQKSKFSNGNLYIVSMNSVSRSISIHKWNGASWSKLPLIESTMGADIVISDLEEFDGRLYLCGRIDSIKGLMRNGNPLNMIQFDGQKWDSLPDYAKLEPSAVYSGIKVFQNKLLAIANAPGTPANASLVAISSNGNATILKQIKSAKFNCLDLVGQKVLVAGIIDSIDGVKTSSIFYYDGAVFSATRNKSIKSIVNILVRNSSEYIVVDRLSDKLELWESDSFKRLIPKPPTGTSWDKYSFAFFDQNLLSRGAQGITHYAYNFDMDANVWSMPSVIYAGTNTLVGGGPQNAVLIPWGHSSGSVPVELLKGSVLKGKVYVDLDRDCINGPGDKSKGHILMEFRNANASYLVYTDAEGNFEITVLEGTYSILSHIKGVKTAVAPCAVLSVSVPKDTAFTLPDLPLQPALKRDLAVDIVAFRGFRSRMGFDEKYKLTGYNYGYSGDSMVLKVSCPSGVNFIKSDVAPFSVVGNDIMYKFNHLEFLESRTINMELQTATGAFNLGDFIQIGAVLVNSEEDSVLDNNKDSLRLRVVAAYDPNIKQCSPEGNVKPGLKKIKYVVHFQNTGNDTAYTVSVVDTFTQKLGLRSLRVTGTSHPSSYSLRVVQNQTLIWTFRNILLPDSHTNEKQSHGFIAFEADINGTIALGDSITNKAEIYFDYQKPVVTNTASVIITDTESSLPAAVELLNSGLRLYPNPASGVLHVTAVESNTNSVSLYNSVGQLIERIRLVDGSADFQVSRLPAGIYIVRMDGTALSATVLVE